MAVERTPVQQPERFPFDAEFQKSLLRLLCEDDSFAHSLGAYLQPHYFENEVLAWAYSYCLRYVEQYGAMPSLGVLVQQTRSMDPRVRPVYTATVEAVKTAPLRDEQWLKDNVLDFVKRNIFARTYAETSQLYNSGKTHQAYDLMMERMEELHRTAWEPADREFWAEELPHRDALRMQEDPSEYSIPTGFPWLDHILDGGLSIGELGLWIAYAKTGKALRNDQLVRTPTGWTPIGELHVGDDVVGGSTGVSQKVRGVFPQGKRKLFEVQFSDGSSVVASDDHVWTVQTRKTEQRKTAQWVQRKTTELPQKKERYPSAWIPPTPLVAGEGNPLEMDPYLLGLLIGDGSFVESTVRFHNPEPDLLSYVSRSLPAGDSAHVHPRCERCPYLTIVSDSPGKSKVRLELERLGLAGHRSPTKFVPGSLFTASVEVRLSFLAGLCDTDGSVIASHGAAIEFSSASESLALGTLELVRSLGGYGTLSTKKAARYSQPYWRVYFTLLHGMELPVRSTKNRNRSLLRKTNKRRHVVSVKPVEASQCTCISVDDPEGLFITNDYVVTHNTTMLVQHGKAATRDAYTDTAHFVFEGARKQVSARYDAAFSGELYHKVKRGAMDADRYNALWRQCQLMRRKLVIRGFTDRWDYSAQDIHDELKTLKRSFGFVPKVVIVDYGDLLTGREKHYKNDYEKQKAAYRDLKSLANRGYAVWTASQAQRPEKGSEDVAHLIQSRQIADAYEKIRVADFIGSLNRTNLEKSSNVMRMYAELYRDNAADNWVVVEADMATMSIRQKEGMVSPSVPDANTDPTLGYKRPSQIFAPV